MRNVFRRTVLVQDQGTFFEVASTGQRSEPPGEYDLLQSNLSEATLAHRAARPPQASLYSWRMIAVERAASRRPSRDSFPALHPTNPPPTAMWMTPPWHRR